MCELWCTCHCSGSGRGVYTCAQLLSTVNTNFCHFLMTDEVSVPVNRVFAVFNTAALFCFVLLVTIEGENTNF